MSVAQEENLREDGKEKMAGHAQRGTEGTRHSTFIWRSPPLLLLMGTK